MKRWVFALLAFVLLSTAVACNAQNHLLESAGSDTRESKKLHDTLPKLFDNNNALDRGVVKALLIKSGGPRQMVQVLAQPDSSDWIVLVLLEFASQEGEAKDAATYVLVNVWDGKTDPKHRDVLLSEVLMPEPSLSHVLYAIAQNFSNKDLGSKKSEIEFVRKSIMELPVYAYNGVDYKAIELLLTYCRVDKDEQIRQAIAACFCDLKFLQALMQAYSKGDLTDQQTTAEIVTAVGSRTVADLLAQQNTQNRMDRGLWQYIADHPDPVYIDSLLTLAAKSPLNDDGMLMDINSLLGYFYKPDDRIVDFYANLAPSITRGPNLSLLVFTRYPRRYPRTPTATHSLERVREVSTRTRLQ